MAYSTFKPKPPARPVKPDRSDEFASVPSPRPIGHVRMATAESIAGRPTTQVTPAAEKLPRLRRTVQAIRDSAKGEECTVRIPGACTGDPAHTIWSHAPMQTAGKGMGIKALDLAGAYACTACDAVVDGQAPRPAGVTADAVRLAWFEGHMQSLVRLARRGIV